jgi:hypothetical protein
MALPDPRLGLVISYNYLWHHEHQVGRDEGTKSRPCVIVLAIESQADGTTMVRVAPVTHGQPGTSETAMEIPTAVKRHLGLDEARSWVILDEVNEFAWPGFDLRPIPPSRNRFAYGFLPPRLFEQLMMRIARIWTAGQVKSSSRD